MAEPADINVDELRRRARRRLVGAIVIALGAAVVVPMLLESEPKPLGDSVEVKIPPVDDGKFVNRLTDNAPKSEAPPAAPREARKDAPATNEAPPKKSPGDAERAVISPPAKAPKYDTQLAAGKAAAAPEAAAPASAPMIAAAPAESTAAKSEPAPAQAPASAPPPAPAPTPAPAPGPATETVAVSPAPAPRSESPKDAYAVQLAAFSDDKGANSLANRLKRGGYPAYTEPLKTSHGTLWRVRVGPYPSRESANGVRDKLKAEGQNGIVAPAH